MSSDRGTPAEQRADQLRSDALEVNLQRTAVEVRIPPEQARLLDILAPHHGVQQETERLLREINHPYAGWSATLDDLARRSLGDFHHLNAVEDGAVALEIYEQIYAELIAKRLPDDLVPEALTHWLRFNEKVVSDSGQHLERNTATLTRAIERMTELLRQRPHLGPAATPAIRRLANTAIGEHERLGKPIVAGLARLCADSLVQCYERWLTFPDPRDWPDRNGDLPEAVTAVTHARLRELLAEIEQVRSGDLAAPHVLERLAGLPDEQQFATAYLTAAAALEESAAEAGALERLHWLCRVATGTHLSLVHEQALRETRRLSLQLLQQEGCDRGALLRDLFDGLDLHAIGASEATFELLTTVGVEVLRHDDADAADTLIEHLLELPFERPDFGGFTAHWSPRVNPLHLAHVRSYLRLIEANPVLAQRLISALVIHLHTCGLFVADTDLFQRDVSRLLAADIAPVYHLVKTLARRFPVYFEEIGAEGELRRISTEIDEVEQRRDPLCHFLRKQCHVESNPELVPLVEAVARYWSSGSEEQLSPYLPADLLGSAAAEPARYTAVGELLGHLDHEGAGVLAVLDRPTEELEARVAEQERESVAFRKVALLAQLLRLLRHKYSLDHRDLAQRLRGFAHLHDRAVDRLEAALAAGDDTDSLTAALDVLEELRHVVLSRERTEPIEDIYHKRHIAVGIPSMYGRYREPRFEAMGLILRTESLANVLTERLVSDTQIELPTRQTLHKVLHRLHLMIRGLRLDGFEAKGLSRGVSMLRQALASEGFSVDQFLDVFRFMSRAMNYLIRVRFLDVYDDDLARLAAESHCARDDVEFLRASETFFRDVIARSFMPQHADRLIGRVRHALTDLKQGFSSEERRLLLGYRPDRAVLPIGPEFQDFEGRFLLGYKGEMVKQLEASGLPTPPGFIVTTEAFRCRRVIDSHPALRRDLAERLQRHLAALERQTGLRYGDPARPLLLSVRSGAAISMPGMMDTFLNVGLTPAAVEDLADTVNPWTAWDSYRRLLQCWGMSYGIDRDLFDHEIQSAKEADGVPKKAQLSAARMRAVAVAYGGILERAGIRIPDDPFEQLVSCIGLVQDSWSSEKAQVYRHEMRIAEEWGTAALVQQMVFGNLGPDAGTGVLFTRDPKELTREVSLYGDFAAQSQGEDIVAGLVTTHPLADTQISEREDTETESLQQRFPAIYERLVAWAHTLLHERGFQHQEIEFTFESPDPNDLYALQSRDMLFFATTKVPTFVSTSELEEAKVAEGIGVGGGALSGRVAYDEADLERLRAEHPDDAIILLRPDTVPEDIPIILRADGMLTTLGGATCHAAVAAQALGRTCVVGCGTLRVDDENRISEVAGCPIRAGDPISINGRDGSVYLGIHPVNVVHRREHPY